MAIRSQEPEIKTLHERPVAYVTFTGNYMGNSDIFKGLFDKLCGWAGPKGLIRPGVTFLCAYYDDPDVTPPEEMVLDVCMDAAPETPVEGDVMKKTLPGGKYAVMRAELTGPKDFGDAWTQVVEWMKERGHEIDGDRASYEIYLNDPNTHPQKHHVLDICMPTK